MATISHNLIGKIDEKTIAVLSEIDAIVRDLKLAYFIVGATARDILFQHIHGIHPIRATLDVDIGVFLSWAAKSQEWPTGQQRPSWSVYSNGRLPHRKATDLQWMY